MGGHVFKNDDNQAATQRINQVDVKPTVMWLEQLTGLPLLGNLLGTTGKKPTSGDVDVAVDANQISKEQLTGILTQWCQSHGLDPKQYVKKTGINVHFRCPINGMPSKGYAQIDFMFATDVAYSKFALSAPVDSQFKGADRHVVLNSIGKVLGYKITQTQGLLSRKDNSVVSMDPDEIAELLLGKGATRRDMDSVESIVSRLETDPKKDEKLADARAYFSKTGGAIIESEETEVSFLARLRDRIVNQGMIPIFEADDAIQGGHAKGIEHFEDLVFRNGSAGISKAIGYLEALAADAPAVTTVKWDGKPAIIWGRDEMGQFVLTDVSGFTAVGYDGLFKSPADLTKQMGDRDKAAMAKGKPGNRVKELAPLYKGLWPLLEKTLPPDFQGYVQGDLLYTTTPTEQTGALVFKPNTVTYRIPAGSELGQQIRSSQVGIAVHTTYTEPGAPKQPISADIDFIPVRGLLLIQPVRPKSNIAPENKVNVREVTRILQRQGQAIDLLFNPTELRNMQITDLPRLCIDYINALVKDPNIEGFVPDSILANFIKYLQTKVTPRKFANIREYLGSPKSNTDALAAAFSAFVLLHDIKMDMLKQLDRQVPGQEGWVIATPGGITKFVNRFDFSRSNAAGH